METIEMTCIICPNGCALNVQTEDGEILDVMGNSCMRGYAYAQAEVQNPTRMLTSTVEVTGGELPRVSVKTQKEIPKGKLMECARQLKGVTAEAPVNIGDVVIHNIAETGIDIVATVNVPKKTSFL